MMKTKLQVLSSVFGLIIGIVPTISVAGESGGGADAILCYSSVKVRDIVVENIKSGRNNTDPVDLRLKDLAKDFKPQLLDLYNSRKTRGYPNSPLEGRIVYPRSANEIYDLLREVIPSFMERFKKGFLLYRTASYISNPHNWIEELYGVLEIDDATFSGRFPSNCLITQVANYDDDIDVIHYDSRITSLFEKVDNEALRIHEDFYKMYRDQVGYLRGEGVATDLLSDPVREFVAFLYTSPDFKGENFNLLAEKLNLILFTTKLEILEYNANIN